MASVGEPLVFPAPSIGPCGPSSDKWTREFEAFQRMLPELLKNHHGKFVAIHDGRPIAMGADKLTVALDAFRQVGNVAIHVGHVTTELPVIFRSGVRRVVASSGAVG